MGIRFSAKIKVKHNYKKFDKIIENLPKMLPEVTENVLKSIRGCAIKLEKGHNEEGILVKMIECSTGQVKGKVYADPSKFIGNGVSYSWFEYFGTGTQAEMPHIGTTKHFLESGYSQWFIPINKVDRQLPYPVITIEDMQFYVAKGVKANHFLTDAEFQTREDNIQIIHKGLHEILKEACK
jgi:hypothetical protein